MTRDRLIALGITIAFHGLIVALLFLLQLSTMARSHPKEITLVPVGVLGEELARGGAGSEAAPAPSSYTPSMPTTPPATPTRHKEPLITQKTPDQPAVAAPKTKPTPKTNDAALAAERRAQEETRRQQEAERERQRAISNKVSNAFGKSASQGTQGKESTGTGGAQGQGEGSATGSSVGGGASLAGRNVVGNGGRPARPTGFSPTRGTVVVRIVVNADGKVIEATQRLRGTNVTDSRTVQAAIRAALATRFNAQPGAADQEGTITYHFDIQ